MKLLDQMTLAELLAERAAVDAAIAVKRADEDEQREELDGLLTAAHEAGHAVAAIAAHEAIYGSAACAFRYCSVLPDLDSAGRLDGAPLYIVGSANQGEDSALRAEWEIVVLLAGPFAEAAALGHVSWSLQTRAFSSLACGGEDDYAQARAVHQDLCKLRRRQVGWRKFEQRAHRLVREQAPLIAKLIPPLYRHDTLFVDEVLHLIH